MFFALHAEIIFAYLLRHFSRIDRHPPEAAGAARLPRHGLTAERHALPGEGTAWRPTATACGRHPHGLRPTPSRAAGNALRAIMHRNQVSRLRLDRRGAGLREILLPMSLPWLLLLRRASDWLLLRPWLLRFGLCLGLCSVGNRVAPRGPRHRAAGLGQGRDMGRPYGLRPMGLGPVLLGTHYASLRVCETVAALRFPAQTPCFGLVQRHSAQSLALPCARAQTIPADFADFRCGCVLMPLYL